MAPQANDTTYYVAPAMRGEIELGPHSWIQATIIDDDDLSYGGKSLSTWYEEDRRRLSGCSEEESRGRQRVSFFSPLAADTTRTLTRLQIRPHYSSKSRHHHQTSAKQSAGSEKKN